jgi:ribosome-associated protein
VRDETQPGIGDDELQFRYSRSSGPGGQNVNKVETRVTLLFDLAGSRSLSEEQKDRILAKLGTRISKEGVLRVIAQRFRTREANRRAAVERFHELLSRALARPRKRGKTAVPKGEKRRRAQAKRRRSDLKRSRSRPSWED